MIRHIPHVSGGKPEKSPRIAARGGVRRFALRPRLATPSLNAECVNFPPYEKQRQTPLRTLSGTPPVLPPVVHLDLRSRGCDNAVVPGP